MDGIWIIAFPLDNLSIQRNHSINLGPSAPRWGQIALLKINKSGLFISEEKRKEGWRDVKIQTREGTESRD